MTRLQTTGHPEVAEAQERMSLLIFCISHIVLSEILHIVDIHSHVVSQTVRHEQTGDSQRKHLIHVSAHKIQSLEPLKKMPCGCIVYIPICSSRPGQAVCIFVGALHQVVYLPLPCGELSAARIGAGEVGCIVCVALGTCIDHEKTARSDDLMMRVVVKGLSVLGKDGSERHSPALRKGDSFHTAHDLLLQDSRLASSACLGVHEISQVACLVDLLDLACLLDKTHGHHGLHQFLGSMTSAVCRHRCDLADLVIRDSRQFGQFRLVIISCRREEVHRTSLRDSLCNGLVKLRQRKSPCTAYSLAL